MTSFLEHIAGLDFTIIGHRGAAGLAPENTLQSFAAALQWHCPVIELDLYATTDQAGLTDLLVIHDRQLSRTTNGRGLVSDFTTDHLRTLDAGNGQAIPLLAEVVELLLKHRSETGETVALNIELKGPLTAEPVASILEQWRMLPVLVSSFDHDELRRFRSLDNTTAVAPLYDRYNEAWPQTAAELAASAVNLSARIATRQRVSKMRQAGYRVFVYTVNDIGQAERLRDMGVSGVFTDRPDKLTTLMEQ